MYSMWNLDLKIVYVLNIIRYLGAYVSENVIYIHVYIKYGNNNGDNSIISAQLN